MVQEERPRQVHRPWGTYAVIDSGSGFQVKKLELNPGVAISLQYHLRRSEHWVVVGGGAEVVNGDQVLMLSQNQSTYIPAGTAHRLTNNQDALLQVIEVQIGDNLGEDDIVRLKDDYGRDVLPIREL